MHVMIATIAAVWAAHTIYRLIPVPAAVDRASLARVMTGARRGTLGEEQPEDLPFWRALLLPFNQLAAKLPPTLVGNTAQQLYWAQFQGQWAGWTEVEFWGLRLAGCLLGLALGLFVGGGDPLIAGGVPVLVYFYLGARLHTPFEKATRQLKRELPEVAQTLSLLISTGKSEIEALQEAASGKGIVHTWLRAVLATRPPDVPLFSNLRNAGVSGGKRGHLRREAQRAGVPALINFSTQVDFLKEAGIGADVLLGNLADTVAADYQGEVDARAEALGDKLVLPVMIFYFVPYLAGLMIPMFSTAGDLL
jgi:Flp pilus assembly protein TadB